MKKLLDKFNALTLKEKILLGVAAMLVVAIVVINGC